MILDLFTFVQQDDFNCISVVLCGDLFGPDVLSLLMCFHNCGLLSHTQVFLSFSKTWCIPCSTYLRRNMWNKKQSQAYFFSSRSYMPRPWPRDDDGDVFLLTGEKRLSPSRDERGTYRMSWEEMTMRMMIILVVGNRCSVVLRVMLEFLFPLLWNLFLIPYLHLFSSSLSLSSIYYVSTWRESERVIQESLPLSLVKSHFLFHPCGIFYECRMRMSLFSSSRRWVVIVILLMLLCVRLHRVFDSLTLWVKRRRRRKTTTMKRVLLSRSFSVLYISLSASRLSLSLCLVCVWVTVTLT